MKPYEKCIIGNKIKPTDRTQPSCCYTESVGSFYRDHCFPALSGNYSVTMMPPSLAYRLLIPAVSMITTFL